jgi:hypothetical protein
VDRVDVLGGLGVGVGPAVEVVERLRAVQLRLEQAVQLQAQLGGELHDGLVAGVDELAAALHQLPVGERAPQRPAAAADAVRGFVHGCRLAGLLEPVGAGQPRQSATHDGDAPAGGGGGRPGPGGRQRDRGRGGGQPQRPAQPERLTA